MEDEFRKPSHRKQSKSKHLKEEEVRLVAEHLKKTVEFIVYQVFEKTDSLQRTRIDYGVP